jgi:L-threonylcarbamoyladenylate synthase
VPKRTAVRTASPDAIVEAVTSLRSGGLVAFPTDTVYGLAADPQNEQAVQGIYEAKDRPPVKPIPLLFASVEDAEKLAGPLSAGARKLAARYWPGALTLVVDAPPGLSSTLLSGGDTVGIRIPDHPIALQLIGAWGGPLGVTSANKSGEPSLKNPNDVIKSLDGRIELVIDGGECPGGVESTVVDIRGPEPVILREGAISREEIAETLK